MGAMSTTRDKRIFNTTIAKRFRTEAHQRTRRGTRQRRLLNHIADILDGGDTNNRHITIQSFDIQLEPGLKKYWPMVQEVCDAVPGIRWADLESGAALGIRPSTARK